MPSQTQLSKTVINAYNTAHYKVAGNKGFVMRIKRECAPLAELMKSHGVTCAAFITAYNPYGKKAKPPENMRYNKALWRDILGMRFIHFEGAGEDPTGRWKSEPSYLILGISLEDAKTLARKHRQNALVWADSDAVPQVILLR